MSLISSNPCTQPKGHQGANAPFPGKDRPERELCIDNLLVRIHYIIEMVLWTGLAPWEFEIPFPGNLISTFLKVTPPALFQVTLSTFLKVRPPSFRAT